MQRGTARDHDPQRPGRRLARDQRRARARALARRGGRARPGRGRRGARRHRRRGAQRPGRGGRLRQPARLHLGATAARASRASSSPSPRTPTAPAWWSSRAHRLTTGPTGVGRGVDAKPPRAARRGAPGARLTRMPAAPDAVFSALADPTRRHLIEALASKPASATRLAADLPISRQAVAKHLAGLQRRAPGERRARRTRGALLARPEAARRRRRVDRPCRRRVGRAPRRPAPGAPSLKLFRRTRDLSAALRSLPFHRLFTTLAALSWHSPQ